MYISLADTCFYASDNIGVLFSSNVPYSKGSGPLKINLDEQFNKPVVQYTVNYNISKQIVIDKKNWTLICDTIRALGGENYITIGNFKSSDETQFVEVSKVKRTSSFYNYRHTAYYYIDDVSLIEINDIGECKCQQDIKTDSLVTPDSDFNNRLISPEASIITLNNICFETDKAELLLNSFITLDSVFNILQLNPKIKLGICGYTDNVGTEEHNLKLSEDRARSVVNYFVNKGISNNRLSYKGYGSANPIASNETEEGRARNRRVVIKIIND